jgi:hypothetical protein
MDMKHSDWSLVGLEVGVLFGMISYPYFGARMSVFAPTAALVGILSGVALGAALSWRDRRKINLTHLVSPSAIHC